MKTTTEQTAQETILPGKFNEYVSALAKALTEQAPQVQYTPQSSAQIRDNLLQATRAGYDQSVTARRAQTLQNRAAIDADAASRGMGSSTWVTDAKMRQNDREASDMATLAVNRNSGIASQLQSMLSQQEANRLSTDQFNAQQRATALANALSVVNARYEKFHAEDPANATAAAAASNGGGGSGSAQTNGWWV